MKQALALPLLALVALAQVSAGGEVAKAGDSAPVSFRNDIAPVLTTSCSTRSCHGGMRAPLLGAHDNPAQLRAAIVGVTAEETNLVYVRPGDPAGSYLIHKIEGRMVPSKCADHDCGDAMPLDNPALPPETRRLIRAWIEQGAQDN